MKNTMSVASRWKKNWVCRKGFLILVIGLALSACVRFNVTVSPVATPFPMPKESIMTAIIQSILADSGKYTGSEVTIVGLYRGWNLLAEAAGQSPVTRSDWVIKDSSGAIYVKANANLISTLNPGSLEDTDTMVSVSGWVRVTADDQPYIEPSLVKSLGKYPDLNATLKP